ALLPWDVVVHLPPPELHRCDSEAQGHQMASPRRGSCHSFASNACSPVGRRGASPFEEVKQDYFSDRAPTARRSTRPYVVVRSAGIRAIARMAAMSSSGSLRMPCSAPAMRLIVSSISVP